MQDLGQDDCRVFVLYGYRQFGKLLQAHVDKQLYQGFLHAHLLNIRTVGQRLVLDPVRGAAYTRVFHLDPVVQAAVLQHGEEVERQLAVLEQRQEPADVG